MSRRDSSAHDGAPEEGTFRSKIVIQHLDAAIGSMSMSPASRDIVLGARSGLYILDLSMPWDVPRFLPGLSTWEVADVQWNIHPARAHWIVSTSGHQALVWNVMMNPYAAPSNSSVEHILTGHRRSVTDINWSVYEPDQLATCALDGWVQTWDLRTPKRPVRSYSGWRMGATQVKWNRQDPHLLASAHDGQALVWDSRNGSVPIVTVDAHETKIYGLDWSRKRKDEFITCSLDKMVKHWRTDEPANPVKTMQTDSPVWRARYTPFGDGVLSLPQRAQTALTLWDSQGDAKHRFEGHKSVCKEFVWRTRGGQNNESDDRDFQLVTWGRDCELHLWPVDNQVLESVGHRRGSPIEVRMTRRHYDNISFRQLDELDLKQSPLHTMKPAPGRSPMTSRGHAKRGSNVSGSPATADDLALPAILRQTTPASAASADRAPAGFVIRGPKAKGSEVDPIGWLTRISAIPEMVPASFRPGTEGLVKPDLENYSLGEEIATAGRKYANRINFEKVQVGNRRCVISCYGPWSSTNSMCFIRVILQFPPRYPSQKPLKGDLISETAHKTRSTLQRGLRIIASSCMRTGTPAIEACLRFLLGEKTEHDRYWGNADADSGEEEEEEMGAPRVPVLRYNIPMPRQCGVSFGPNDQIALFFARPLKTRSTGLAQHVRAASESPAPLRPIIAPQTTESTLYAPPKKRRRVFESFGVLAIDGEANEAGDGSESDEALRFSSFTKAAIAQQRRVSTELLTNVPAETNRTPFSTTIHIRFLDTYTLLQSQMAGDFSILGDPYLLSVQNIAICRERRQDFLAMVWTTMAELLCTSSGSSRRGVKGLQAVYYGGSFSEKTLEEMILALRFMRDTQTLGLMSCYLEARRRQLLEIRRAQQAVAATVFEPKVDHPDHQEITQTVLMQTPDPRTPLERPMTPMSESAERDNRTAALSRTAASWSSLGAFLSSASLSLSNKGTGSTSNSPTSRSRQPTSEGPPGSPTPTRPRRASTSASSLPSEPMTTVSKASKTSAPPVVFKRVPRPPARAGISVTFGGTSVIAPESSIPEHASISRKPRKVVNVRLQPLEQDDLRKLPAFLLSEHAQSELEVYRLEYADLLGRWGYALRRVEVLGLTIAASTERVTMTDTLGWQRIRDEAGYDAHTTLMWAHLCATCGGELKAPNYTWCERCYLSRQRELCCICHAPINGLVRSCFSCLHAGHPQCLDDWHRLSDSCPAGCGCNCVGRISPAPATTVRT